MRAKVWQVAAWVGRQIRALRDLRRTAARWLRDHASHCVASGWLVGLGVFGGATIHRALAAPAAEAPTFGHPGDGGAIERVAMLDVDEINGIRTNRMHALGLAAAGEGDDPGERTIQAARASLAHGIDLDGENVATAGKLVVVTRGGIAGWLKRNRGKKADPETLAWLRGEEAAEGRASYAGWADRQDGNILNWARERRHPGAAPAGGGAGGEETAAAVREAGAASAADATQRDGVASAADAAAQVHLQQDPGVGADARVTKPDGGARAVEARAAADPPHAPAVQGLELFALGGAAATALTPRAAVDPSPDELAALHDRLRPLTATGAIAVSVRDHHVVLILLCDQLFERAGTALTDDGEHVVRALGHVLAAERGQAYSVTVDRDRAFELVSNLAIAGLAAERVEIALEKVDRALDVVEVEWLTAKEAP